MALFALRSYSDGRRPSLGGGTPPVFALRLLIASHCQNTTSQGLAEALEHFPNLAFLDLSRTLAARDRTVLAKLGNLPLLQVLKLRNVHLRDEDMVSLADAIGIRVRSLDVSENDLTDHSIRTLLGSCFDTAEENTNGSNDTRRRTASNMPVEDWPSGFVRPDPAVLDEFRDESYDERFVHRLTSRVVSRLPFEDLPQAGITHLCISDNQLSVEGLAALIRSKRLHVLDAGSIDATKAINRSRSNSSNSPGQVNGRHLNLPGVEKLNPVLFRCGQEMTSLRIDHSVVTGKAPPVEEDLPLAVCELATEEYQQPPELEAAVPQIAELGDTALPMYELDSREVAPAYELPAAPVEALSPVTREELGLSVLEQQQTEIHRGSVYSPEVANHQDEDCEDDEPHVLTATGLGFMAQAVNGVNGSTISPIGINTASTSSLADGDSSLSIALMEKQRKDLRAEQISKPHGLVPAILPKLRTLTLTKVPCHENNRKVINALIAFVKYCSLEAKLAADEARFTPNTLRKPNQPNSRHYNHQTAREIFALQRLVLEMAPAESLGANGMLSPQTPHTSKYTSRTKSSTEDADSEAMWSASENDFTFFDDEEECGLPAAESGTSANVPFSALPEKMIMPVDGSHSGQLPTLQHLKHPVIREEGSIDVIKELTVFRKERKSAFESAAARGVRHVDGYWPGEVKVVRGHGLGASAGGKVDYYGNYFESGIYR